MRGGGIPVGHEPTPTQRGLPALTQRKRELDRSFGAEGRAEKRSRGGGDTS